VVGRRSPGIDRLLLRWGVRQGAFLSAWNPGSRKLPPGWNRRMERALLEWLRTTPHHKGWGEGRGWRESHVLAALPPRPAVVLARRFRQAAITVVSRGGPARLLVLQG
jgi:hypothetical protein